MSNSKHTTHPPPPQPPSLFSLPEEIVLSCLARVPEMYHLNLLLVSKNLRALVRSLPEFKRLQPVPHKHSLYLCFLGNDNSSFHWFTLTTTRTTDYRLFLNPTPFPSHPKYGSSTVVSVGSKIFFIGRYYEPSSDLWILNTRSGNMTQGPSMSVPRVWGGAAVGVVDGKIYVIGGGVPFSDGRFQIQEETQVEVFDPKSGTWELAGAEYGRKALRCSASVEGKVYMVENNEIDVYNPREGERERMVHMVSHTLAEGGRKERLKAYATVRHLCVVEDVLFALFDWHGRIMWFDTKCNVWRRLVGPGGNKLRISPVGAMAEHDGKLAVLELCDVMEKDLTISTSVRCELVSLQRAGDRICGKVDWSGSVGTVPYLFRFLHCVAVSN
ncbi:Galactose oxidase/kelch repeat superfamily protein [Raphanus sativus]|nr:Galactose oxidase/kelch repeat superfamily protein [Raphanus sativus]